MYDLDVELVDVALTHVAALFVARAARTWARIVWDLRMGVVSKGGFATNMVLQVVSVTRMLCHVVLSKI